MNYPDILHQESNQDSTVLKLAISPKLDAFSGHFDEFPIVPGVVQIQWALHFFNQTMGTAAPDRNTTIDKISALKFQHVITPDTTVNLTLSFDASKHCLTFKINNDESNFSSGKLFLNQKHNSHG